MAETFRSALAEALELPEDWELAPYELALDTVEIPTVLLRYEGFDLVGVDAPTGRYKHNFMVVLISPVLADSDAADADLDTLLDPMMTALNGVEWIQVTAAEKRPWNDQHGCFAFTLNFYAPINF